MFGSINRIIIIIICSKNKDKRQFSQPIQIAKDQRNFPHLVEIFSRPWWIMIIMTKIRKEMMTISISTWLKMPPMQTIKMFESHIVSGIIVDEEVEEEVEGSRKWTDRTLMLQHGLLTAVEVEEDGDKIQRIRGRLVSYPSR